ncbi:MAG: agmatine deiminase family protein [Saprospiraceae bacterium]|nr:agmatine deiminase family protein [Candidatus Vicinibacter affinis]
MTAYLNSLIVNKTIYVPLFQIKADSIALQTWQKAMPGYTVKGFEFALKDEPLLANGMNEQYPSGYGWKGYDALHCRTRAIWDNEMLFITTKRIDKIVDSKNRNIVYTTIIDYSKQGLVKDKNLLFWRTLGETNWRIAELNLTENPNHFFMKYLIIKKVDLLLSITFLPSQNRVEKKHNRGQHLWEHINSQ